MAKTSVSNHKTDISFVEDIDIPEALRDETDIIGNRPASSSKKVLFWSFGSAIALGFGVVSLAIGLRFLNPSVASSNPPTANANPSSPTPVATPTNTATPTPDDTQLLGHLKYPEATNRELVAIRNNGRFRLRPAAATKFQQMQAAARRDGVNLVVISAFRSIQEQQILFFKVKEQRGQVTSKRAEVSAPPGYSEHHTGYAMDLGDGRNPGANLKPSFEQTAAFRWLATHAAYYSFELSFTKNNSQGVSYEPWHWRFVGDQHSLETFYRAHHLTSTLEEQAKP